MRFIMLIHCSLSIPAAGTGVAQGATRNHELLAVGNKLLSDRSQGISQELAVQDFVATVGYGAVRDQCSIDRGRNGNGSFLTCFLSACNSFDKESFFHFIAISQPYFHADFWGGL